METNAQPAVANVAPESLDDLPQEVLKNIWRNYFCGRTIYPVQSQLEAMALKEQGKNPIHNYYPGYGPRSAKDSDICLVFTVSRTQAQIAREAMLQETTVRIQSTFDICLLLRNKSQDLR